MWHRGPISIGGTKKSYLLFQFSEDGENQNKPQMDEVEATKGLDPRCHSDLCYTNGLITTRHMSKFVNKLYINTVNRLVFILV